MANSAARHYSQDTISPNCCTRSRADTAYTDDLSNYNRPKRPVPQNQRLELFSGYFDISLEKQKQLVNAVQREFQKGLEMHKRHGSRWVQEECSFKMIDSFVEKLPTGDEKGIYYAVDFGGTNLRAVRVDLKGEGVVERTQAKYSLKYEGPSGHGKGLLDRNATATQLFDHFAQRVKKAMEEAGDLECLRDKPTGVGFTFSFPCAQEGIDNSRLIEWTKGFETGRNTEDPVEGEDAAVLLNSAFRRADVPASVKAVLNDTVGTLLSCAYQKPPGTPPCLVGIILGTGCNGCYVEPSYKEHGYTGRIINIELGNYHEGLPLTEVDLEIDWNSPNRGRQMYEKLVSGAYLGEMVRRCIIRVFQNRTPERAWVEETFSAEDAATVLNDETPGLEKTGQCIIKRWNDELEFEDLRDVRTICTKVFDRSAALAAVGIAASAMQTGALRSNGSLCIGVDGSLYVKNPWYAQRVKFHLANQLGEEVASRIIIFSADDGSGKGAAILAATI